MTPEREIVSPVDLCGADGRLRPDAIGWTRTPLHRANLRGWGRSKRWEYWGVVTPSHVVGITIASLDYLGLASLYVLDRASGRETERDGVAPFARGIELADRAARPARGRAGGVSITLDEEEGGTRITASAEDAEIQIFAERPIEHEALGVVVPWSERLFQYTVKDVARPARGRIVLEGRAHEVAEGSFAVLDHGRGRWPYANTWNWAAGSGARDGRAIGIQLGGKWTDGTGSTENALLAGGRLHKISEDLTWSYDRTRWTRPWRIHGARVDATLHPFHERCGRVNLIAASFEAHQCFGHFEGWATTDAGETISLDGLVGWAEEAHNRW
ncbi:MAG: DUF2804 domain-containing protein [Sandaracinaceae bacterium]|nr:DUF2804 domain-containing protein [Sandaracinaceae bacterium]